MHKCLKCGQEFEGKFCPQCGTKWIDPDTCPKCGAHHAPDAKFCQECGARLDGKTNCPKCGTLLDATATFCVECGTKLGGKIKAQSESAVAVSGDNKKKVTSVLALCGVIFVLISALTGLIFTFVSGVSIVDSNSGSVWETQMLYYYFGDVYEEIDELRDSIKRIFEFKNIGEMREYAMYFPATIGTAVSALGILGVVTLSALTGYRAYKKFCKKEEANVVAPASATYLTFVALATLLLALNSADGNGVKTTFSAPTLAGLITGGIFLGLGVLLIVASKYESLKNSKVLVGAVLTVVVCAFTAVVFGLLALPAGGLKALSETVCYGAFSGMQGMLMLIGDDDAMIKIVAYGSVGGVAGIALAVICVVMLIKKISSVCTSEKEGILAPAVVAVVLSAVYLTFTILMQKAIADEAYYDQVQTVYTVPIVMLVFSVFALAGEIADKVIGKKEVAEE